LNKNWSWPFSRADLTAGLRRYYEDHSLQIRDVHPLSMATRLPSIGRIRGLEVIYETEEGEDRCRLVVKEPAGTTRAGLAGAGRREVGVYRSFAEYLPLSTPRLIASSQVGDWLIMEELQPEREAAQWLAQDYFNAIESLADLHDRFWDLEEDLSAFPWLSHPIKADFEIHVTVAAKAIERIVHSGHPEPLATRPERMRVLAALTMYADRIVSPLLRQTHTLLHGDYWPGNIAILADGRQVVLDWQLAGVGPGVLDLLVFINKSAWWFGELPVCQAEIVRCYKEGMYQRNGVRWDDEVWDELMDHALMWRFLEEWVDLLAVSPEPLLLTRAEQLDSLWLKPVAEAVARRLELS
jgi:hypothetical protein